MGVDYAGFKLDSPPRIISPNVAYYHKISVTVRITEDVFAPYITLDEKTRGSLWPQLIRSSGSSGSTRTIEFIINPNCTNFGVTMHLSQDAQYLTQVVIDRITVELIRGVAPKG